MPEIEALVVSFEDCDLPRSRWDHQSHLAISAWYVLLYEEPDATRRMIEGIIRYNAAAGLLAGPAGGFHETITIFWMRVAYFFLASVSGSVVSRINRYVLRFQEHRNLPLEYYSVDLLFSERARCGWVEPDLRSMPVLRPAKEAACLS